MLISNEIQSLNNLKDLQSKNLDANSYPPSFRGSDETSMPSAANIASPKLNDDKFEKKTENLAKDTNKLEITLGAIAGTSVAGLALTWGRLGKILKLAGVAIPFGLLGRISKAHELSLKDGLTGLFNKKTLLATLSKDFKGLAKKKENYSVAMLDMDNFKGFNEIFDHDKGDEVLKRIAGCIQDVTKKHKVQGFRYGGEEFAIVLANHNNESAQKILEEISESIRKDNFIQGLLPDFKKQAQEDIAFMSPKMTQINEIFARLKETKHPVRDKQLAEDISTLVEKHIEKYRPTDSMALKKFIARLKAATSEDLRELLDPKAKIGEASTLGNELDKIYVQYKTMRNDREKWLYHIDTHKMFTVSGGLFNFQDSKVAITNSEHLLQIADAALKSAKENRKNVIITANDEIISKVIERLKQEKAAKSAS